MIEMEDEGCDSKVKTALEQLQHGKFELEFFKEKCGKMCRFYF